MASSPRQGGFVLLRDMIRWSPWREAVAPLPGFCGALSVAAKATGRSLPNLHAQGPAMKKLKLVLLGLAVLALVAVAALALFVATFDANRYKPQLAALVKEKTGRTLTLEGELRLSLFPKLGVRLGRASLSERGGQEEFAALESARVSLALGPLLRRQVVVDEVALTGLRARLVKLKDGSTNYQDLLVVPVPPGETAGAPQREATPAVVIDIDRVVVSDATLHYRDETQGREFILRNLNLNTGRIANDVPSPVDLSFTAVGKPPDLNLDTRLQGRLTFNLETQRIAMDQASLQVSGSAAQLRKLELAAKGDLSVNAKMEEFGVEKLKLTLTGERGGDALDLAVDAPKLILAAERYSGERVSVRLQRTAGGDSWVANLAIADVQGNPQAFQAGPLQLTLDGRQGEQTFKVSMDAPLTGNLKTREFRLKPLKLSGTVLGPALPRGQVSADLAGEAAFNPAKETASTRLQGTLLESPLSATVDLSGYAKPKVTFAVAMERLDLDRLAGSAPPQAGKGSAPGAASRKEAASSKAAPLGLAFLEDLDLNGVVKIGKLKVANLTATDVNLAVKAGGGRLTATPSAALYQGKLSGNLAVAATQPPSIALQQRLTGVHVGPLLRDLNGTDRLEGRGTVSVDLAGQGASVEALKKTLRGTVAFQLQDGAIKGVNIAETLREAKAALATLRGKQVEVTSGEKKTDFSELSGTFLLKDGVARNDDLTGKSPLLRLAGAGTVDIVNDTLDYLLKATVVATSKGQGGAELSQLKGVTVPVRVSGPLAEPRYEFDFGAIAGEVAKRTLEREIQRRLGAPAEGSGTGQEAPPNPLDALKELFKK